MRRTAPRMIRTLTCSFSTSSTLSDNELVKLAENAVQAAIKAVHSEQLVRDWTDSMPQRSKRRWRNRLRNLVLEGDNFKVLPARLLSKVLSAAGFGRNTVREGIQAGYLKTAPGSSGRLVTGWFGFVIGLWSGEISGLKQQAEAARNQNLTTPPISSSPIQRAGRSFSGI